MNSQPRSKATLLKNGTINSVSTEDCAVKNNTSAAVNPTQDCQEYLARADKPFELRSTSFL